MLLLKCFGCLLSAFLSCIRKKTLRHIGKFRYCIISKFGLSLIENFGLSRNLYVFEINFWFSKSYNTIEINLSDIEKKLCLFDKKDLDNCLQIFSKNCLIENKASYRNLLEFFEKSCFFRNYWTLTISRNLSITRHRNLS